LWEEKMMGECRGCLSRDLAPVRGSDAFQFCRLCLLVQRRAATPASRPGTAPFGPVDRLVERHRLGPGSLVVAVGGAALLDRIADRGVPVLAIEEDRAAAAAARVRGVPVIEARFGVELGEALAAGGRCADLLLVPCFGRLADPAGAAAAAARLLKVDGTAEFGFASAAEIVPLGAWAAVAGETILPTLAALEALLAQEGLHLNDAARAGRHHLLRATASNERRRTARLAGLLDEEARLGAGNAVFYGGAVADLLAPRRAVSAEGTGVAP
jgi:hypothetical protein